MQSPRVLFTDLDGTIVHYPDAQEQWGEPASGETIEENEGETVLWKESAEGPTKGRVHRLLRLPPSSTGLRGVISERTLRALAEIRAGGVDGSSSSSSSPVALVVVTGARMTTLCRRLPFLPACDAVAAEGGGRLFWTSRAFPNGRRDDGDGGGEAPSSSSSAPLPTLCDLREDAEWRMRHASAAGPPSVNEGLPPAKRQGPLWDLYRDLEKKGWSPDAGGYSTSFRLPVSSDKTEGELDDVLSSLPPCLSSSRNLGCADVYPSTSGKESVGRYVASSLGAPLTRCAFLMDDDNDLPLAAAVGKAFVVGKTHESVARAVAEGGKGRYWTTELSGTMAADAAVEAAGAHLRGLLSVDRHEGEALAAAAMEAAAKGEKGRAPALA